MKNIVIVGFGSIGQAILPFLRKDFPDARIVALDKENSLQTEMIAEEFSVDLLQGELTEQNAEFLLSCFLSDGDLLLNIASEVCSLDLIKIARTKNALYVDAGIEPWQYQYGERASETSNQQLREKLLNFREQEPGGPTAVIASGANPGFISVLVKQALWEMAQIAGIRVDIPKTKEEWANLSAELEVQVIQVSEYDSQKTSQHPPEGELWNTWSLDGFLTECQQQPEIGWGTHEQEDRNSFNGVLRLNQSGWTTRVKSWTPIQGEFEALVLTHHESISISEYLTVGPKNNPTYRPTVYYAYRPSDCGLDAASRFMSNPEKPYKHRVIKSEITTGCDELGVFLLSKKHHALWYGSALSIERVGFLAKLNNATSLQVVSSIMAATHWAMKNPTSGIVETEDIDHEYLFNYANRYWAPFQLKGNGWMPMEQSGRLDFDAFLITNHAALN